jgi:hypothetical protein
MARRRYLDEVTRHQIAWEARSVRVAESYAALDAVQRAKLAADLPELALRLAGLDVLHRQRPSSVGEGLMG